MLRRSIAVLFAAAVAAGAAVPAKANPVSTDHATATLLAEPKTARPGEPFWVALKLDIAKGWHTYWRNPGDAGEPTHIVWSLPDGVAAGEIQWPYPERVPTGPLTSFAYKDEAVHLVEIRLPADWPEGESLKLAAEARWLICEEICIPEAAELALELPTGPEAVADPATAETFAAARTKLPLADIWQATHAIAGEEFRLALEGPADASSNLRDAYFFPYEWGAVEPSAPQRHAGTPGGLTLAAKTGPMPPEGSVEGVLVLTETLPDGAVTRAYAISAPAGTVAALPALPGAVTPVPPSWGFGGVSIGQALLFALLGGLILNLMPCVFPVLSMKILGLVAHQGESPGHRRLGGLIYTAGVLTAFAVVGVVLLAIKSAGAAIGWGFQLQSPIFVAIMAYVLFALGLSLSGLFNIGLSVTGAGSSLAARSGHSGTFFTGVLATVVATPCTAPFMGAAVGFALMQPAAVSMTVLLTLGLGLALPYLILSFAPGLGRWLPKPGPWMERVKQFLAFPLYASAAWLVWVLARQAGADAVGWVLAGFVLIAFALWLWRVSASAGFAGRLSGAAAGVIALAAALGIATTLQPGTAPASATAKATVVQANGLQVEPFSTARLDALRAEGTPVFVNMTADWCISCLVNERVALSSVAVAERFAARGVVYLKGDWTNHDPQITAFLESFGRSGVPLYVLYPPGNGAPQVLPQLLTETIVFNALDRMLAYAPHGAKTGAPATASTQ